MNYDIQNLEDITDSREILESRPHPFTTVFIYIVIAIVAVALIWSWFGQTEIVVKTSGVVRPNNSIIKISNKAVGRVESINFKDGQAVKKGQILYTVDHGSLDIQKSAYEKELKMQTTEINNMNKLKQSIKDGKNYFDKVNDLDYYNQYNKYVQDCSNINGQVNSAQIQINNLKDSISKLQLLQKSINDNTNYFDGNSSYSNQYSDYEINVQEYQSKLNEAQKLRDALKNTNGVIQSQIDEADANVSSSEQELEKYKNQYTENLKSNIEQSQQKLAAVEASPSSLMSSGSQVTSQDEYKNQTLIQLDSNIKAMQEKLDETTANLKNSNANIDDCTIKAEETGVINSLVQINKGDLLQGGIEIADILPNKNSKYKIQLYISNSDIGNIKKGQQVKLKFSALSYREYGSLASTITNISADSKVNEKDGTSYYTAEAVVFNKPLYSHKGEQRKIKSGMTCEGDIVTRKEKIFYYVLEKLNLKD